MPMVVTKESTFADLNDWISLLDLLDEDQQFKVPTIVVGNKSDLLDEVKKYVLPKLNYGSDNDSMKSSSEDGKTTVYPSPTAVTQAHRARAVEMDETSSWSQDRGAEYFEVR
jgi:hypothetical protein